MLDPVFALNERLRSRLSSLSLVRAETRPSSGAVFAPELDLSTAVNVVVTANEVSDQHGTGPLIKRVCAGWPNILSIRARDHWGGVQDFGSWNVCLSSDVATRSELFHNVLRILCGRRVETVLCVPFLPDEFFISIALHECFGARLCAYLMDDQNIAAKNISDSLMQEFLNRCSLRLATHPELQWIYQQKYRLPFHVLPAVVPAQLISSAPVRFPQKSGGALIGSFWDQSWFDRLCSILAQCGRRIDWFGNNKSPWLNLSARTLTAAGITAHGIIPEERLANELSTYPFVIVPVGALDEKDSNTGVARLSLPGRILFAVATSNTPILVVGSEQTCGARFVKQFGIGEVVPYDATAVAAAMERMSEREPQERMRRAAAKIASSLSAQGISDWLRESIAMGRPADPRFEDLFSGYTASLDGQAEFAFAAGGY